MEPNPFAFRENGVPVFMLDEALHDLAEERHIYYMLVLRFMALNTPDEMLAVSKGQCVQAIALNRFIALLGIILSAHKAQ